MNLNKSYVEDLEAEVERLTARCEALDGQVIEARAEVERLRAALKQIAQPDAGQLWRIKVAREAFKGGGE